MFDLIFSEGTIDRLFIGNVDPRAKTILFLSFISAVLIIPTKNFLPLVILKMSSILQNQRL